MADHSASPQIPVAVVGVSALFPGSAEVGGFWRDILAGRDLITDVPPTHWLVEDYYDPDPKAPDKTYARRGSFLSSVDFDPVEYGLPPNILPATDTAQLLALIVAKQVLEDAAQGQFRDLDKSRISVILGVTSAQELLASMVSRLQRPVWVKALRESGLPEAEVEAICERIAGHYVPWQESTFPGLLGNVVAGRIANRFDLGGTNCVTDAACASAFAAVSMAVNELALGSSELVITGGVDTLNDIFMFLCFSKTPALSPTGDCRPFSDQADGTLLGEGLGMVALKRLDAAERDGDRIYAVLRGIGSSSDGRATSVYAPLPEGQAQALRRAYAQAGYGPETVELVEAHGTGTKAGDVAEFESLRLVFDASGRADRQWCALGSIKSQIGHTKAAAGAAGLCKAVLALHHKVLPPTLKVERPNPKLDLPASPFYVNTRSAPWVHGGGHPRRASVSSFGFGGSNFHLALEEYAGEGKRAWRLRTSPSELVLLAADDAAALAATAAARAAEAAGATGDGGFLRWLARDSQESWKAGAACRLAVVATDEADLAAKLRQAAESLGRAPGEGFAAPSGIYCGMEAAAGKVAFLFPGQGSQYTGMGGDLAMAFDEARAVWDRAAALPFGAEARLHEVVFPRPAFSDDDRRAQEERLTRTEWAQPAIGAVSLSQLALLRAAGLSPDCAGGHSFGAVTALCAAGALDADALLAVARRRGELMAEAAEAPGAMTAVTAAWDELAPLLAEWGSELVAANHNAPRQVVLSGATAAVEEAERRLAERGIRTRRLPVGTAFHSPLVAAASGRFRDYLADVAFAKPRLEVYSDTAGAPYAATGAKALRAALAEQLTRPVRFREQVEAMVERGVRTFVEVGPGAVLTGLVGDCLAGRPHLAVALDRKGRHGLTSLWHALGRLAAAGVPFAPGALWQAYRPAADPRAAKKPKHALAICGSNYGKPYPPPGGSKELPPPNPPRPMTENHVTQTEQASPRVGGELASPRAEPSSAPTHSIAHAGASGAVVPSAPAPPPPSAPAPAAGAPAFTWGGNAEVQLAWVQAYQEAQRQTVEAHAAFQRTMAETQMAFLRATEISLAALSQVLTGQPLAAGAALSAPTAGAAAAGVRPAAAAPTWPAALPVTAWPAAPPAPTWPVSPVAPAANAWQTAAPVELPNAVPPAATGAAAVSSVVSATTAPLAAAGPGSLPYLESSTGSEAAAPAAGPQPPQVAAYSPAVEQAPSAEAPAAALPDGLDAVLLSVVAEKTGYPVEMLGLEMDMESDLGIDSIKRVEVFSGLRERVPGLPEIDPAGMASLRTLGQIVAHLSPEALAAEPAAEHGAVTGQTDQQASPHVGGELASPRAEASSAPTQNASVADPVASQAEPPAVAALGRFALREVPCPPLGLAMAGLRAAGLVAVTDEGAGIAEAVAERLAHRGIAAQVVREVPADAGAVIFLGALAEVAGFEEACAVQRRAFRAARAVAARRAAGPGVFVTVQDTGGDFGLAGADPERAWLGGLPGLVKTAAQEWPEAAVKAIDLERGGRPAAQLADAIVSELLAGGPELEVGLHADGRRTTLESYAAPLVVAGEAVPPVLPGSVLLASGGARGVTAACLAALARDAASLRLVLLGRTALEEEPAALRGIEGEAALKQALLAAAQAAGETPSPAELARRAGRVTANREVAATLATLRAAGAEVRYLAVDIRDAAALAAALAPMRREWGPITGLVHGAGVLADRLIADKTEEQFDRVFGTKVEGLRNLLAATAEDPLAVICLFSSVAARCGNAGQSDYAMANEVLNRVAAAEGRRRAGACRVKALNWGPWESGMVTPALKARFEGAGVPLIPLVAGARMLADELRAGPAEEVEVVLGGEPRAQALLAADACRALAMEAFVSAGTHPYLEGHQIHDVPVLPVVLVLEWFLRLARACRPDLTLTACRDLKVLRGVRLLDFHNGGHAFRLHGREISNGHGAEIALELRGHDGHLHYTAVAEMAPEGAAPRAAAVPPAESDPWPYPTVYGDVLFHGPKFQVIRELHGVSAEGIAGVLAGTREMGWDDAWLSDPAALDGGLQLAVLWFKHQLGGASLPTAVAAYRAYADGPAEEPVHAVLKGRVLGPHHTVSDIAFLDGDGRLLAELEGVETHRRPGEGGSGGLGSEPQRGA